MLPGSYPVVFQLSGQLGAPLMVSGNGSSGGFVPRISKVKTPRGLANASKPDRDRFAKDYVARHVVLSLCYHSEKWKAEVGFWPTSARFQGRGDAEL